LVIGLSRWKNFVCLGYLLALAGAFSPLNLLACQVEPIELTGKTMGPIDYRVTIVSPPPGITTDQAQREVQETLDRINRLMSNYRSDSDVSLFNDSQSTDWFDIDPETAFVIQRSLEIGRITEGAFDVTVSPAIDRWRFGAQQNAENFQLPSDAELAELKKRIGFEFLDIRMDPAAVRKSNPAVQVNLSGIAKGYAVDAVAKTLRELGCRHFFVDVGGEVFAEGKRIDGTPWRVGIQNPDRSSSQLQSIVGLSDRAIATSGDYESFFAFQGRRYSHTIDPSTCQPVENLVASVSVVAEDCMTADAMATAIIVLGPEKGLALAEKLGLEILVQSRDKDFVDRFTSVSSENFPFLAKEVTTAENNLPPGNARASILPVFFAALIIILIAVASMAIGTIFGNRPITGSCGGLANRTNDQGESVCGVCAKPTSDCPEVTPNAGKSVD